MDIRTGYDYALEQKSLDVPEKEGEGTNSAFTFLCIIFLLTGFGLIMLYSSSYDEALSHGLPHYYYLVRQLAFVALACVVGLIVQKVPVTLFHAVAYPFAFFALVLMGLTLFTPLGSTVLGARRWLRIGPLSLQPVEIAKIAVIFLLAQWFSTEQKNSFVRYFPPFVVMALFALLILMQKDFSSTVVFVGLCLSMFVAGGMSIGILLLVCGAIAVPTVIALFTMPYRIRRIASFLMPDLDTNGANYQVSNAIKAIEKGGLFGVGLGKGVAKQGILPEVQNDFIFASMFEELGLIWMLFLVALFVMFAILGYKTFVRASRRDPFLGYLDFGMTTMVVWQAIINIAVVTGLLPPTGIPLPFFSQGGTNIFVVLVCCAVMYRIMLISSGRQPLEKSHLRKDQKKIVEFPSTAS